MCALHASSPGSGEQAASRMVTRVVLGERSATKNELEVPIKREMGMQPDGGAAATIGSFRNCWKKLGHVVVAKLVVVMESNDCGQTKVPFPCEGSLATEVGPGAAELVVPVPAVEFPDGSATELPTLGGSALAKSLGVDFGRDDEVLLLGSGSSCAARGTNARLEES